MENQNADKCFYWVCWLCDVYNVKGIECCFKCGCVRKVEIPFVESTENLLGKYPVLPIDLSYKTFMLRQEAIKILKLLLFFCPIILLVYLVWVFFKW